MLGIDGAAGDTTTVTVDGATCTSTSGHALLTGAGCQDCVIDGLSVPSCYDYGIVIKECSGTEVTNCNIMGGASAAIYCKAARNPNIHHNYFRAAAGYVIKVSENTDTGNKSLSVTMTYNHISAYGSANCINWADADGDSGGSVCDYNIYRRGPGLGSVYGTGNIITIAALMAAWSTYDVPTNDSHSRLAPTNGLLRISGRIRPF